MKVWKGWNIVQDEPLTANGHVMVYLRPHLMSLAFKSDQTHLS